MAETKRPVRPLQVDYECDECGNGVMRPTGMVLTSHPPQYPHECTECAARKTFRTQYPHIEYVGEGEAF